MLLINVGVGLILLKYFILFYWLASLNWVHCFHFPFQCLEYLSWHFIHSCITTLLVTSCSWLFIFILWQLWSLTFSLCLPKSLHLTVQEPLSISRICWIILTCALTSNGNPDLESEDPTEEPMVVCSPIWRYWMILCQKKFLLFCSVC